MRRRIALQSFRETKYACLISHGSASECDASSRRFQGLEELRRQPIGNEICDRFENSFIDIFLRFNIAWSWRFGTRKE